MIAMQVKHYVQISPRLIKHIRTVYELSLTGISESALAQENFNVYTEHALPVYILSVAVVEAFINEAFLSFPARLSLSADGLGELLDKLGEEWVQRVELDKKLILVPHILFGKSLSKSEQPYQDMALLIKVRNELTHYKMTAGDPKKGFKDLEQRGISLVDKNTWPQRLFSVKGIRWAHNTACLTVRELTSIITVERYRKSLEILTLPSFDLLP
jgi:hypothetical protein